MKPAHYLKQFHRDYNDMDKIQANEHVLTTWGLGSASVVPSWFFQGFSTTTPTWWRWYQTGGAEGVEPTAAGKRVLQELSHRNG